MKRLSLAVALFAALIVSAVTSSAAQAKTFVGVLWPMFGPLPAIGLVELTAEVRAMPDVEVHTYLHQEWPDLVKDISHLPEGTRTIVIGYSLGANATSWVVNKSKYIDLVIALQPSMLSWNPTITGHAGRIIEVYNPNTWETFGGMGSKKLEWTAGNIEFMPNHDSHPGAQFDPEFRSLVKTEVAKMTAGPPVEVARADSRGDSSVKLAYAEQGSRNPLLQLKDPAQKDLSKKDAVLRELTARDERALEQKQLAQLAQKASGRKYASAGNPADMLPADQPTASIPVPAMRPQAQAQSQPAKLTTVAADFTAQQPQAWTAFLDTLSGSVDSGNLAGSRELTVANMMDYAKRKYDVPRKGDSLLLRQAALVGGDMIVASNIDPHRTEPSGVCCAFVKADGDLD